MQFPNHLFEGVLVQRYKRFLADIQLMDGQVITAHCPNPGSMLGLKEPGSRVWVSKETENAKRQYAYTWQMVEVGGSLVSINTHHPNVVVAEALRLQKIPELAIYPAFRSEVSYGDNCRIDFLLEGEGLSPCYLEVKTVHLKRQQRAEFPDAITQRGVKHLQQLTKAVQQGARAVILYVVQRQDCDAFSIAADIDANYWAAHQRALLYGVEQLCYQCKISLTDMTLERKLTIHSPND